MKKNGQCKKYFVWYNHNDRMDTKTKIDAICKWEIEREKERDKKKNKQRHDEEIVKIPF